MKVVHIDIAPKEIKEYEKNTYSKCKRALSSVEAALTLTLTTT